LGVAQKWLPFVGQKLAILLVELCDFPGNNHSFKSFISLIKKTFETGPEHFSQATQISYICNMHLKGKKECCAQAFATVLAIRIEISEEQSLTRIPGLVRSNTVLTLGSDTSCPTIGLK